MPSRRGAQLQKKKRSTGTSLPLPFIDLNIHYNENSLKQKL
jgi:hypothetical protein